MYIALILLGIGMIIFSKIEDKKKREQKQS